MSHKNKTNQSPYTTRQAQRPPSAPSSHFGKHKKPETIYGVNEANDRLLDIFQNHQFDLVSHSQRQQLAQFYQLLMFNQEHQNFTRLLKLRDVAIKHFIDSIVILKHSKLLFPLIDVGTGPGFPGIPLKIMFPQEKILLGEGVQKRVEFLKHVRSEMNLQELDIIGRNINSFFVYPVRGVITRAVEDISNTLGNVLNCLQVGGRVFLMKGPGVDPEIPLALEKYGDFYKLVQDVAYTLPMTPHQRRLIVFEKIKNSPLPDEDPESDLLLDELSSSERRRWAAFL